MSTTSGELAPRTESAPTPVQTIGGRVDYTPRFGSVGVYNLLATLNIFPRLSSAYVVAIGTIVALFILG
ncbi:MAG: hypothetical protein K0S68_349 [Candidatus Saccharibacteria bacterium]|jgi:hypothetical protein|nr:hypothetical protein [Candidatus Saccharibacteria bacterium]